VYLWTEPSGRLGGLLKRFWVFHVGFYKCFPLCSLHPKVRVVLNLSCHFNIEAGVGNNWFCLP